MQKSLCSLSLVGLLALGAAASTAVAQDSTPPPAQTESGHMGRHGMNPDEQLKHLTKTLSLSADQQSQIKPLLDSSHQQIMQVHEDQSLSRQDKMTKMKGIMDDTHSKIEGVLNDQQKQKFEAMMQKEQEHRQQHMQGGGSGPQ
jgi:hypothetical protein